MSDYATLKAEADRKAAREMKARLAAQDELIKRELANSDPNKPLDFTPYHNPDLGPLRRKIAERRMQKAQESK